MSVARSSSLVNGTANKTTSSQHLLTIPTDKNRSSRVSSCPRLDANDSDSSGKSSPSPVSLRKSPSPISSLSGRSSRSQLDSPNNEYNIAYLDSLIPNSNEITNEFKSLEDESFFRTGTSEAEKPYNRQKNRYSNILPFDSTRVVLSDTENLGGDYINANFIRFKTNPSSPSSSSETRTPNSPNKVFDHTFVEGMPDYICTQGPLDLTVGDFWRMIWEQKVKVIIMLTNVMERSRVKCFQYWPNLPSSNPSSTSSSESNLSSSKNLKENLQLFHFSDSVSKSSNCDFSAPGILTCLEGKIQVRSIGETIFPDCVVRDFSLFSTFSDSPTLSSSTHKSKSSSPPHLVTQFHFQAWPDFGVPSSPWGVLDLLERVKKRNLIDIPFKTLHEADPTTIQETLNPPKSTSPIVVHCSAGVGRTGTLVAIHSALRQYHTTKQLDLPAIVRHLRAHRPGMIQTLDQYDFCYQAFEAAFKKKCHLKSNLETVEGSSLEPTSSYSYLLTPTVKRKKSDSENVVKKKK